MNANHKPTPWTVVPCMVYDIRDAEGKPLAGTYDDPDGERRTATARRIVTAVNCHDDLLTALRDVIEAWDRPHYGHLESRVDNVFDAIERVRPVLTKATGRE